MPKPDEMSDAELIEEWNSLNWDEPRAVAILAEIERRQLDI